MRGIRSTKRDKHKDMRGAEEPQRTDKETLETRFCKPPRSIERSGDTLFHKKIPPDPLLSNERKDENLYSHPDKDDTSEPPEDVEVVKDLPLIDQHFDLMGWVILSWHHERNHKSHPIQIFHSTVELRDSIASLGQNEYGDIISSVSSPQPSTVAVREGYCLLLDELHLAPTALQTLHHPDPSHLSNNTDQSIETKKKAAQNVGNIIITNSIAEVRAINSKALGSLIQGTGEDNSLDLSPGCWTTSSRRWFRSNISVKVVKKTKRPVRICVRHLELIPFTSNFFTQICDKKKTDEKNSWFGFDRGTRSWPLSSFITMYPQGRRSECTQGTQAPPRQPHENHVQPSSKADSVTTAAEATERLTSLILRAHPAKMRLHQGHSEPNKGPTNLKPPRSEEEKGTEEEKREFVPVDSDRRKVRQKRLFDAQHPVSFECLITVNVAVLAITLSDIIHSCLAKITHIVSLRKFRQIRSYSHKTYLACCTIRYPSFAKYGNSCVTHLSDETNQVFQEVEDESLALSEVMSVSRHCSDDVTVLGFVRITLGQSSDSRPAWTAAPQKPTTETKETKSRDPLASIGTAHVYLKTYSTIHTSVVYHAAPKTKPAPQHTIVVGKELSLQRDDSVVRLRITASVMELYASTFKEAAVNVAMKVAKEAARIAVVFLNYWTSC
ncbi:hypothetical protein PROFUN_13519 [Planoprotostelium fungivorum]|uniref:Uncharacterized protein n=1 Tax=Planoprotostelium fungivorum TaxID=1890364 RepID=A0A2P6N3H9_9EUKA|nr:hypothetical protein PROFUN_13519 [Planoprotostelium fungivorum]